MQVFRYYRDLINFRGQGDPSLMLRCINPAEAQLLDAAAGVHVRFRLAGVRDRSFYPLCSFPFHASSFLGNGFCE